MLNDYGKLYLLGLAMFLGTAVAITLIIIGEVAAGTGVFGGSVGVAIGYLTGNGVLASKGGTPSPVFVPTQEKIIEHARQIIETEDNPDDEGTRTSDP